MKRYNEDNRCPKCGQVATTRYGENDGFIRLPVMVRTCTRCRYSWHEAPLDAPSNQGKETT